MFTVTLDNFQSAVVQASNTQTIVLDFASPRSPASTALTQLLAKIEADYGGAFTLGTVNCDTYPQIASAFQVQQVPTVIVVKNGQPIDGFSGTLPEASIVALFNKHVQALQAIAPEVKAYEAALQLLENSDNTAAIAQLRVALSANNAFETARLKLVELLTVSAAAVARAELHKIQTALLDDTQTEKYQHLLNTLLALESDSAKAINSPEILALKQRIEMQTNDLAARFELSQLYKACGAYELALEQLLCGVQQDRHFQDSAGRKGMIEIFNLASEMPIMVRAWRQKLSAALN